MLGALEPGGEEMKSGSITPSEMVCLHEILNLRNTCAVKSDANKAQVTDQRLSKILEQDHCQHETAAAGLKKRTDADECRRLMILSKQRE